MDISKLSMEIQERIKNVLQNDDFRKICLRERNRTDFDEMLTNSLKIAGIDVSNIHENRELISNVHLFTPEQIKNDVFEFYASLDSLEPNGINLIDRLKENSKYIRIKPRTPDERAYCRSGTEKNGSVYKEIFINLENRVGDTGTAIHELCHSCCTQFMECIRSKDCRVSEIPSVITDQLSSRFLKKKYPLFAENFLENDKFTQKQNVKKARECVFDALLTKVMCGEISLTEVFQGYGDMFNDFPDILENKLRSIERNDYKPFYEYSYLVPQAIALEMRERFKTQPELVAKQLKEIIKDNHKLTEEQVLDYLGLPQKDKLLDDYASKFQDRIQQINAEQKLIKDKCLN